jgi:hypothetical protein
MYNFIQNFILDGLILPFNILVIAVVNALWDVFKKEFTLKDRKIALFAFNSDSHSVFSRYHFIFCFSKWITNDAVGMGGLTTESRLLALEHPLINIIAITLTR